MPGIELIIRRFIRYMFLIGAVHTVTSQAMGALTCLTVTVQCGLAAILTERDS